VAGILDKDYRGSNSTKKSNLWYYQCTVGYNLIIKDRVESIMASASAVHILVKTQKLALDLKLRLDKGANFDQLARKFSVCPSKKRGGDLGEFKQGQMVKAFDDVVFKKELLKVHGPVKTKFGYHLIKTLYRS
jgi:peptidyl-prolyl cis-trans isomerase C